MPRQAASHLKIPPNIRCQKVTPKKGSKKQLPELKTVGFTLSKEQAVHLAITLLAASRNWDTIDVTAYRFNKRKSDGTHIITVTSFQKDVDGETDETNGGT